jgi:N-acetyl sugar amidotransferase
MESHSTDPYRQCSRCVMDTSDPDIKFDGNGHCNHCVDFLEKRALRNYQGEKSDRELVGIYADMKKAGKGKKYDCIIGISGGVDSSYAAYLAKKNGLRVLAVHLDNGWNSDDAVLNIKNIAKKLEIDYESYVLDWKEFRELQLSFLKASVPEAETPTDIAILAALFHYANKYKIKHIISGGNFATEGILPKHWHYDAKDKRYLKSIHKQFGNGKIKKFPTFGFLTEMYYKIIKKVKIVYLLNYVPYKKEEAIAILEKELDWKNYGGKHHESKYTAFIQSYYLMKKFGIDFRRANLASLVVTGFITKEEALRILETLPYNLESIEKDKAYIAKKLGITIEEFEDLLNAPPKWYTDYPNNERKLAFIYNTYRKLYRQEKLGSF